MQKLNAQKYMRDINDNVVQGCLSKNYLTWKVIAQNILDMKYSQFTVSNKVWNEWRRMELS